MKIIIDEKVCKKHNLTLEEVLFALAVRKIDPTCTIPDMLQKEIIVEDKTDHFYMVTQHWSDVLDEILCDSIQENDEDRLLNLAKQMRELYPAGKMPNTAFYYRCNNAEVIRKLKKFFITYGQYSDEQILNATTRFVNSFHGDYKYLPLIKYFISKLKPVQEEDGTVHNVEFSPLADYLENKEGEGEEINTSDDWLVNSKN